MKKIPADGGARDCPNIMIRHQATDPMRDEQRLRERSGHLTRKETEYYEQLNKESTVTVSKLEVLPKAAESTESAQRSDGRIESGGSYE